MPLFGDVPVTNHIMWDIVQPLDLFVTSSFTVVFNADPAGIVIFINRHINHAPVFIVVDTVLNKV